MNRFLLVLFVLLIFFSLTGVSCDSGDDDNDNNDNDTSDDDDNNDDDNDSFDDDDYQDDDDDDTFESYAIIDLDWEAESTGVEGRGCFMNILNEEVHLFIDDCPPYPYSCSSHLYYIVNNGITETWQPYEIVPVEPTGYHLRSLSFELDSNGGSHISYIDNSGYHDEFGYNWKGRSDPSFNDSILLRDIPGYYREPVDEIFYISLDNNDNVYLVFDANKRIGLAVQNQESGDNIWQIQFIEIPEVDFLADFIILDVEPDSSGNLNILTARQIEFEYNEMVFEKVRYEAGNIHFDTIFSISDYSFDYILGDMLLDEYGYFHYTVTMSNNHVRMYYMKEGGEPEKVIDRFQHNTPFSQPHLNIYQDNPIIYFDSCYFILLKKGGNWYKTGDYFEDYYTKNDSVVVENSLHTCYANQNDELIYYNILDLENIYNEQ